MNELPDGWCAVSLGEIADFNPGIDKDALSPDELVPFVPMHAVEAKTGRIDTSERRPFSKVKSGFTSFATGDVLFAKITPCMENGKMAIVPPLPKSIGFGTTEFHVLRPRGGVDPRLLYYFVSSSALRHEAQHHMTGAVGQKRVPRRFLEAKQFRLPPLAEQERIVEKIETLFSELDKGEETLRAVQELLARYRKSVLKAAVTGALTADWRAANGTHAETGNKLLNRILKHRRETWQGRGRYADPVAPDIRGLPPLPDGWAWASLDQLVSHLTSGSRDWKQYYGRGSGTFIMAQNVRPMHFDLSDRFRVDPPKDGPDAKRSEVRKNDLLITIVGANTGDVCLFPLDVGEHYVCQSVALMRLATPELASFVELFLSGKGAGRDQLEKHIYGAGRPHLGFEQLRSVSIPLPPPSETIELMERVVALLSNLGRVEDACREGAMRSAALRQSILKDAFTGKLVPQDPADEPAEALLARIVASRDAVSRRARKKAKA